MAEPVDAADTVPPQRRARGADGPAEQPDAREQEARRRLLGLAVRRAHLARRREVLLHVTRS